MGQISELKYGFYNSYKLDPNERFYATPFDVAYLSHITAQVVIIKPSGTIADGQINVDWYDADDVEVGTRSSHTITPTQLWSRKTATFEVPTGAVNAKLHFFGGEQGYNISCPMCEPGEIASAFSGEVASRLAYMSSEGGYFGLLNAGQIVAGKLIDPTEKAWFDLDKPEIVMKGVVAEQDVEVSLSPEMPLELKIEDEPITYISPRTGKLVTSRADINEDGKVDELDLTIVWTTMYHGTVYPDWVMERADINKDGWINSNDAMRVIDDAYTGGNYIPHREQITLTYSSANELTADIDRNIESLIYEVYPMYIVSPVNAITARSMLTVRFSWDNIYTIVLYDPLGGFSSGDEVEVIYLTGQQIRSVGVDPIENPFPGWQPL